MRDNLLQGIKQLCSLYPPLSARISYSELLSKDEVNAFGSVVNWQHGKSCNLVRVRANDVAFVQRILAAASGNDCIYSELKDIVLFLRRNRQNWWVLHNAYEKIVRNGLVGTCPLATSTGLFGNADREFQTLFHNSIHFVLEENGLCFNDAALDEDLVAYFHEQVMGRGARACYVGEREKYLRFASVFEREFSRYPRSAVVPLLFEMKQEKLKAQ